MKLNFLTDPETLKSIELISKRLGIELGAGLDVKITEAPKTSVSLTPSGAEICYRKKSHIFRGISMLTEQLNEGKEDFEWQEDELREIDDFAYALGIEVVPCFEFYGHMEKYLIWPEAGPIRDTASVLLAREDATFEFLEESLPISRVTVQRLRKSRTSCSLHSKKKQKQCILCTAICGSQASRQSDFPIWI